MGHFHRLPGMHRLQKLQHHLAFQSMHNVVVLEAQPPVLYPAFVQQITAHHPQRRYFGEKQQRISKGSRIRLSWREAVKQLSPLLLSVQQAKSLVFRQFSSNGGQIRKKGFLKDILIIRDSVRDIPGRQGSAVP